MGKLKAIMKMSLLHTMSLSFLLITLPMATLSYQNEYKILEGHKVKNDYSSPLPIDYLDPSDLPNNFTWGNVNGVNYLTRVLNQHIPQYCGSCWAHGAISSLSDRIKIAQKASGPDIDLSIQYILNCAGGMAGSCHGGSASGVYEFVKQTGYVPYGSCIPYLACSSESKEGFCPSVDTTCSAINTCRTCNTFTEAGGKCVEISYYPNATVQEYGSYHFHSEAIKAEIFARGPVAAAINAEPIVDYQGGVVRDYKPWHMIPNHVVSIVGWGTDATQEDDTYQYWIVRNSWGDYWGEMGFFRVEMGRNVLGIEEDIDWATPGSWTERNFPCSEDGQNCRASSATYVDPSTDLESVYRRLQNS